MKYIFILLSLLISFCEINAQNESVILRAKTGDLSFEECRDWTLLEQNIDLFPSLLKLKDKLENDSILDCDNYFYIINLLSAYYSNRGDYYSISLLLDEACEKINEHAQSTNNEYLREIWLIKCKLEALLKNNDKALEYLLHTLQLYEEANDFGVSYFTITTNIAYIYMTKGELLHAKLFMDEAIETIEKLQGDIFEIKQEVLYVYINIFGMIYESIKDYKNAEKCYRHVINNCKQTQISSEAYQLSCNNLSFMLMKQNKWEESLSLLLDISESKNIDNIYTIHSNLALNYLFVNNYKQAIEHAKLMNETAYANFGYIFSHFTESERENYWDKMSKELLFADNLIAYKSNSPEACSLAYNNIIYTRNLLLSNARLISDCVERSKDEKLKTDFILYKSLRNELAFKTTKEKHDSLKTVVNELERKIVNAIGNIGEQLRDNSFTWKDVKKTLDDDEYAIEFTNVTLMEQYPDADPHYGAYIIGKHYESPKFILLEREDYIEKNVVDDNPDELFINSLYSNEKNRLIYELIWKKIEPYLKESSTIYYTPTSYLSYLNMEIIEDDNGKRLSEKYNMRRVNSTSYIYEMKKSRKDDYNSAMLFGNIHYDESLEEMRTESEKYDSYTGVAIDNKAILRSMNERGRWGNIPATKKEIYDIAKTLGNHNRMVEIKELNAANEESFKNLSGNSPDIIHLATHGFVIDNIEKATGNNFVASTNFYSYKESFMMWTGLLLAGANNLWTGQFAMDNVEDGILTAEEISQLDLSNTKLVVMSACETGKGFVDPIDGIIGLQRAFKKAGAKTIVMSLWRVNDDATSLMMSCFYKYLINGKERHEALELARKDVEKEYPDPFYWAGFIMLD